MGFLFVLSCSFYDPAFTTSCLVAAQLPGWYHQQGPTASSPIPARGDVVSFHLLGSRSTGGMTLRGGSTPASCNTQGEDGTTAGDVPAPRPRMENGNIEPTVEREGGEPRQGMVEEGAGRRVNPAAGGNSPSPGRGDTELLVKTGTPVLTVSDWSLTSCDDVDDGAVSRQRASFKRSQSNAAI